MRPVSMNMKFFTSQVKGDSAGAISLGTTGQMVFRFVVQLATRKPLSYRSVVNAAAHVCVRCPFSISREQIH